MAHHRKPPKFNGLSKVDPAGHGLDGTPPRLFQNKPARAKDFPGERSYAAHDG